MCQRDKLFIDMLNKIRIRLVDECTRAKIVGQNQKQSDTGGLVKTLRLQVGAKAMLTVNIDIIAYQWPNGNCQTFWNNWECSFIVFIQFEDVDAGRNLILSSRFARENNWVPMKNVWNIFLRIFSLSINKFNFQ